MCGAGSTKGRWDGGMETPRARGGTVLRGAPTDTGRMLCIERGAGLATQSRLRDALVKPQSSPFRRDEACGGYQGASTILEGKWRFQEHLSGGRGGGEELSPCDIFPRADSVPTAAFVLDVGRDKVHLGHDI